MAEEYELPFSFQELEEEEKKSFYGFNLIRLPPTKTTAPPIIKQYAKEVYNFKPRPDDIWLMGFPRSGTTLLQEILYLLGNDLDYEKAKSELMDIRFPYLYSVLNQNSGEKDVLKSSPKFEKLLIPSHERLLHEKNKRFIKTHHGFEFIHPKILEIGCKLVFVARNPKDVLVSGFYYPVKGRTSEFTFDIYWHLFQIGIHGCSDYFELLKGAWERRHSENMLILFYEEINADKRAAILKIAEFLGKTLTEDQLDKLLEHVDIDSFKKNKSLNNDHYVDGGVYLKNSEFSFIRQGKSGGWEKTFPPHLVPVIDEWIKKGLAEIPDFKIPDRWSQIMKLT